MCSSIDMSFKLFCKGQHKWTSDIFGRYRYDKTIALYLTILMQCGKLCGYGDKGHNWSFVPFIHEVMAFQYRVGTDDFSVFSAGQGLLSNWLSNVALEFSREMSRFFPCYNKLFMIPDEIRKNVGRGGEDIACTFLVRKGFKIIERNYRRKSGEIDIIAEKDGTVRFVEVKAVSIRGDSDFSREMDRRPEELVHKTKLRKLARTAALYMEQRKDEREYQIDAVAVLINEATRTARCKLYEQALEENL